MDRHCANAEGIPASSRGVLGTRWRGNGTLRESRAARISGRVPREGRRTRALRGVARSLISGGRIWIVPTRSRNARSRAPLSFRENKLRAPLCAQCRSPMTIAPMRTGLRGFHCGNLPMCRMRSPGSRGNPIDIERPYTEPRLALNARTCALNAAAAHASMWTFRRR